MQSLFKLFKKFLCALRDFRKHAKENEITNLAFAGIRQQHIHHYYKCAYYYYIHIVVHRDKYPF